MTGPSATARRSADPAGLDRKGSMSSVPNVARIYDYLLGGKDNFAADRAAAGELLAAVPDAAVAARANRRFLGRAVWHLARDAGIRQFLDIGTRPAHPGQRPRDRPGRRPGRPGCLLRQRPAGRRARQRAAGRERNVAAVHADLRQPRQLLALPTVQAQLDLDEPVAVLLVAVLHFIEDSEDPWAIVEAIKQHLAPGSFVVISHVTADEIPADAARQAADVYKNASAPGVARTKQDIARFFDGLDMVEPGLADVCTGGPDSSSPSGPLCSTAASDANRTGGSGQARRAAPCTERLLLREHRERAFPDPGPRWCQRLFQRGPVPARSGTLAQEGARMPAAPLPLPRPGRWIVTLDGQRLRQLRRQHGLSQERLADLAGVSLTTVARLERQPALTVPRARPSPASLPRSARNRRPSSPGPP